MDQKRRKQLDAAFRRPNEVLAKERELIRELRTLETQIKRLQTRGVGALGAKTSAASGGLAGAPGGDVKPKIESTAPALEGGSAASAAPVDYSRGPRAPPVVVASASILLDDPTGDSAFALDDLFPYGGGPMSAVFGRRLRKPGGGPSHKGRSTLESAATSGSDDDASVVSSQSQRTQETQLHPDSDAAELLAISSLATQASAPYKFPVGPSRAAVIADPSTGVLGSATAGNPFAGIALRSVQLAAPIDGMHPTSRTLAKANAIIKVREIYSRVEDD